MRTWILPLALAFTATTTAEARKSSAWEHVRTPAPGPAESIGGTSAGCLKGAVELSPSGPGYERVRLSRHRGFGHPRLVSVLKRVGVRARETKIAPFVIGDMGLPRGGPMVSGHGSHQTGLDADIWFSQPAALRRHGGLTPKEREGGMSPAWMLDPKTKGANLRAFGERERTLLRLFSEEPEVDRIFVNPALKRELCTKHAAEPWIRKVRAWYGHDHHFHIRLSCTPGDAKCAAVEPVPEGNGCDASLEWWGGAEAKSKEAAALGTKYEDKLPELPPECASLLPSGS